MRPTEFFVDNVSQDYKARFAKSTIADEDSFYVQFGDNQLLHRRRQKLLKSSLILDSSIEIAQGCMQFCHWLSAVSDPASSCSELFLVEMALYISKIRGHKRTVNLLLRQSTGTSNLVGCRACPISISCFLTL